MSSMQANAVPDSQLGLSLEEIALLRQHQQAAAGGGSSSSRAASRASSQGMLMIDSSSLAALGRHFDRVMQHIQNQLERLMEQSQVVTMQVYDRAGNLIDNADAEIARYHDIMHQIDELELDFDRIAHIRDIVRGFRRRAEQLERDLDSAGSTRRDGGATGMVIRDMLPIIRARPDTELETYMRPSGAIEQWVNK